MKPFKITHVFILLLSVLLFSCSSEPQSNGWRGPQRDGVVKGFQSPATWPSQLNTVWTQQVGFCDASPVLVNNRLYLHVKQEANEVTLCLDAETGKEIWRTVNNPAPEVTGGARPHPGPRSTPYITDGKVYTLGVGGALNCLDAASGELIWKNEEYTEVPVFFAAMSPLVDENKCFVHMGGKETGTVAAFNASSGEKLWELKGHPSTYSSPVIMKLGNEKVLVVQTETDLLGISMDGRLLWKTATPGENRFYNSSTPVLNGQNIIIAGQGLGTKSFKVEKSGDGYTLTEAWSNPEFGVSFNTPLLKDGYLYGHEARLGKIYCMNANTGETAWSDTISHNRFASNLDLGNEILSLTGKGELLVYEPTAEKYTELASYPVAQTDVYAHPVVAGNRIYIKDKENLTCWEIN